MLTLVVKLNLCRKTFYLLNGLGLRDRQIKCKLIEAIQNCEVELLCWGFQ